MVKGSLWEAKYFTALDNNSAGQVASFIAVF